MPEPLGHSDYARNDHYRSKIKADKISDNRAMRQDKTTFIEYDVQYKPIVVKF